MIVSASYRTDIPAYYGAWFLRRLAEGYAQVASPYGGADYRVSLARGDVDGFVFWTRNAGPFADALAAVRARSFPFVVQFTITGCPRAIEPGTLDPDAAVAQLRALARDYGPRAAVWRYDPILVSDATPPDWHRANFARLAARLAPATDEVVVSFVAPYRKTARNLAAALSRHGLAWRDPPLAEKRALVVSLAAIAADHGMRLTLCTQPHLFPSSLGGEGSGVTAARCIDAERLSDVAGRAIAARTKGNRPGCLCAESRDIGAYDTCAQGCAYCYAVSTRAAAQAAVKTHDDAHPRLAPPRVLLNAASNR
jgi:DNA repair photolyase